LCSPQKRQIYDQQLQIFRLARKRLFNRANLWRAALATLGVLAVAGGIYLSHDTRGHAWNDPGNGADQAMLTQVGSAGAQSGN